MEMDEFIEKLNKVQGNVYVIEEEVELTNGVYEAQLQHDNVNEATLTVYTGSRHTGDKIDNYSLSTPSLMPWKRIIRIYADASPVYISYETEGDVVESEDVNMTQAAIVKTQKYLNAEVIRAQEAEDVLTGKLEKEAERSLTEDELLKSQVQKEVLRAEAAELQIASNLIVEKDRAFAAEAEVRNMVVSNRPIWEDKYTRNEVDNKFSTLETALDWKEAVETYNDLKIIYQKPEDGWTVNVKDTDYTYRWNGDEWIAISANSIPKATYEVDGLLSKEDKILYDDANSQKHLHENKSILDTITKSLLDEWNIAHKKMHEHSNIKILNGITQMFVDKWNSVENKVDKENGKGLSTNDFTDLLLEKINGINMGANVNVQSDWNVKDTSLDSFIKNKPSSLPASGGNAATVNGHTVNANVPLGAKFTDTVYTEFGRATSGKAGLVPAPAAWEQGKFLRADGTWQTPAVDTFIPKGATWNDIMGV